MISYLWDERESSCASIYDRVYVREREREFISNYLNEPDGSQDVPNQMGKW